MRTRTREKTHLLCKPVFVPGYTRWECRRRTMNQEAGKGMLAASGDYWLLTAHRGIPTPVIGS